MAFPDSGRFTYAYDAVDRMTELTNPRDERSTLTYNALGRITQQEAANGNVTTQAYDTAGRMTGVTNAKSDGSLICRFTYTHDAVGNRAKARRDDGVNTADSICKYDTTIAIKSSPNTARRRPTVFTPLTPTTPWAIAWLETTPSTAARPTFTTPPATARKRNCPRPPQEPPTTTTPWPTLPGRRASSESAKIRHETARFSNAV